MRVLLDECLPRRLKDEFLGHHVRTAPEMGWASKRNGELLQIAQGEFDVFVTVDRNLQHEQDLANFDIAVIVLVARSNRLDDLRPLMGAVRERLLIAKPGAALVVEGGKS